MGIENYEKMDKNILLSMLNMKLRDEFDSLESLCRYYDISEKDLELRLLEIDYKYFKKHNQFK